MQVSKLIYQRGTGNELLDFIKVQEPGQLKELTQHASTSVLEAMNTFIQRLVGSTGDRRVEVSNSELATTFYFLIVVGYFLRQLEVGCWGTTKSLPQGHNRIKLALQVKALPGNLGYG